MQKFKGLTSLLVLFATLLCFSATVSANGTEVICSNSEKAQAIYLYSYTADRVLYSQGVDIELQPTSSAKMLACLVACKELSKRLDEEVTLNNKMLEGVEGASLYLKSGMTMTVRDLLYCAVCGGGNDAILALAVLIDGDADIFVERMNSYAREINMKNTEYKNPTGLDAKGAYTTLQDVALLAKEAVKDKLYLEMSGTVSYNFLIDNETQFTVNNRNGLISQFYTRGYLNKYALGLASGGTDEAGYMTAAYSKKNENAYLCIVMGAKTDTKEIYSYKIANELLELSLDAYTDRVIAKDGEEAGKIKVELTDMGTVELPCVIQGEITAFLPKSASLQDIEKRLYFHEDKLIAPVKIGDVVGGMDFYYNGSLVARARVILGESAERGVIVGAIYSMKEFLSGRIFIIFLLIAIPSISIYLYFDYKETRHKKVNKIRFK